MSVGVLHQLASLRFKTLSCGGDFAGNSFVACVACTFESTTDQSTWLRGFFIMNANEDDRKKVKVIFLSSSVHQAPDIGRRLICVKPSQLCLILALTLGAIK